MNSADELFSQDLEILICETVWLMTVVVHVCRLGEGYMCGRPGRWVAVIKICIMDLKKKKMYPVCLLLSV